MTTSRKIPKKPDESINFEKSMEQLSQLIEKMETGQLSLEESLKQFETGVILIRQCQQTLAAAEQKIQILTGKTKEKSLVDFELNDE